MSRKRKEPVQKQETDSSTDSDDESTTKRLKSEVHVIRQAPEASQFPFFPPSRTEDPLRQAARSSSRLAASRTYIPEVQERMESLVSAERIALQDHFGTTDVYFQEELEDLMVRSEFAKVVSIYANPSTFVAGSVFDYVRGRHDERTDKKRKNARTDAQRANLTRVFLLNENAKVGTIMLLVHSDLYDAWLYYCKKFDQDPELEPANCEPQAALWLQSLSDKTYKDLGHMKSIKDVNERAFVRHSMARVKTPTTGGLRVAAGIPVELSRNPTKAEQESGITERLTPNLNAPRIYNTADRSTSTDTGDLIFFSSKAAKMAQAALVANGVAIIGFTDVVIPEPSAADGHIVIGDPVRFHVEPQVSVTVTQDQRTVQVGEETYEVLDEIVDKGESQEEDMEVEAIMATPSTSREPQRRLESRSGSVTPPTCAPSTLLRSRSSQRREARLKAEEETGGVVPKKLKKNQYRVLGATPEDDTLDLALHPEDFFSDVESLGSHHKALTRNERELVMGRFKKPRFTSDGCILAVEGARYWVGQRRDPDCPKPFCTIAANNLRQTDFEKT